MTKARKLVRVRARNPQDATLRNIRALQTRMVMVERRIKALQGAVVKLAFAQRWK